VPHPFAYLRAAHNLFASMAAAAVLATAGCDRGQGRGTASPGPVAATAASGAAPVAPAAAAPPSARVEQGRQIYEGHLALVARLAGHDQPLPALATRCVNCHELRPADAPLRAPAGQGAGATPVPASAATRAFAPALDGAALVAPRSRRGGPTSAFDARSLCQLLRTGIDPASVIIDTAMPRYELTDEHCDALWSYFTRATR